MGKKEKRVLQYLEDFGSITSLDAFKDLGDTRLAATIFQLRKKGYDIISETQTSVNRYGDNVHFAKYFFKDKEEQKG